jgi:hypothetical protein
MKKLLFIFSILLFGSLAFSQSDDELFGGSSDDELFSDDDLFGGTNTGDDDLFDDANLFGGDDDLFADDGIDEVTNVKAKSDLSKGVIFDTGNIKIGGNFQTSIGTMTTLYADDDNSFGDNIKDTKINPNVGAYITVDARPNQDLRMYSKFGLRYPFSSRAASTATTTAKTTKYPAPIGDVTTYKTDVTTTITDWIYLKELFTDFSVADTAFFRFGLHTVTWDAGYFFSPVSDIINSSSINPEDVEAQVDGCFNLRTQITIPNSQNCFWLYVLPAFDYAKNTVFAGKYDLLLGGWELGFGGYYKHNAAPKVTFTATGSIRKLNLFGEAVFQYGSDREWNEDTDKSAIFRATAGFMYTWKTPSITLAGQYYYDGNNFTVDTNADIMYLAKNPLYIKEDLTKGHNVALLLSFGRIFGTTDLTASVFGMVNFGKEDLPAMVSSMLEEYGASSFLNAGTFSAMLNYAPTKTIKMGIGPYMTFADWDKAPVVSLKLEFTLGGGKF